MTDLILHQYEMSPFSEKMRRILAWKGLEYRSVRAPAVMPKPDLVALTGGYRRIPVLQVGGHVYCDTALMARVLDGLSPRTPLFEAPGAELVADWADGVLFDAVAILGFRPTRFDDALRWLTPEELAKMGEDRTAMVADGRRRPLPFRVAAAQTAAQLARLEALLAGRDFLLGAAPSIADLAVYHSLWFLERLVPERLEGLPRLRGFMDRVAAPADPVAGTLTAEEALAVASRGGVAALHPGGALPPGLEAGAKVQVTGLDGAGEPVVGELLAGDPGEIVVGRDDPRAGRVCVHFPRVGYAVAPV